MTNVSHKISDSLHLVSHGIDQKVSAPAVPPACHRMFVIDCSGSMYGDLPKLRQHLKTNLSLTVANGDTVSIVWFSGRNQFGVLLEGVAMDGLQDMNKIHTAIDRYLKPVGLTGFKEPLMEVMNIISRLKAKDSSAVFGMTFMSDGYDNQWSEKEILAVTNALGDNLASATVVEYGWYANRPLLTKMSESLGGEYVFSEDFSKFSPIIDSELRKSVDGAKKREISLSGSAMHDVAFTLRHGVVSVYGVIDGKVRVPEDVSEVLYLSANPVGEVVEVTNVQAGGKVVDALYVTVAILAQRMLADDVFKVLKVLGDVSLIRQFANCFGKQAYSAFNEAAIKMAVGAAPRYVEGYNPNLVPKEDAYTVLDLLADLMDDEESKLHISHPAFSYQRIGRKTINAMDAMSVEEQAEIANLTASAKSSKAMEAVQKRIQEILDAKPKAAEFVSNDRESGIPMSKLVLNETRPNVSVLTQQHGVVKVGPNGLGVSEEVPSFIFRNYNIIRDGILNTKVLPVSLSRDTHAKLAGEGLVSGEWNADTVYEVDLTSLPIINRMMVKKVSAREMFTTQYELAKVRAAQKVFKFYEEKHFPKDRGAGLKEQYGENGAEWLKSLGVTDGGFSPKVVQDEASDVYIGRELKVAIKGLSSLPKVDDVLKKVSEGKKLTIGDSVMKPYIDEVEKFLTSDSYVNSTDKNSLLKGWLHTKATMFISKARKLNRQLAESKFSIVVGQVWFSEFSSLDEGSMVLHLDGQDVTVTATMREIEVAI